MSFQREPLSLVTIWVIRFTFAMEPPLWDDFGRVRSWDARKDLQVGSKCNLVGLVSCKQPEPGSPWLWFIPTMFLHRFWVFFIPIWGRFPILLIFFKWVATTKLERLFWTFGAFGSFQRSFPPNFCHGRWACPDERFFLFFLDMYHDKSTLFEIALEWV